MKRIVTACTSAQCSTHATHATHAPQDIFGPSEGFTAGSGGDLSSAQLIALIEQNQNTPLGAPPVFNGQELEDTFLIGIYKTSILISKPLGRNGALIKRWSRIDGYQELWLQKEDAVALMKAHF